MCAGRQDITRHVVTAEQQAKFEEKLVKFFYTTLTPLQRIESLELKDALSILGASPPSRRNAGGRLLDDAYNLAVDSVIQQFAKWSVICITMDGWKKRACEHGAPLVTIVLLLPDGASLFWKVSTLKSTYIHVERCRAFCDSWLLADSEYLWRAEDGAIHCCRLQAAHHHPPRTLPKHSCCRLYNG
jgi:hypothetical protein